MTHSEAANATHKEAWDALRGWQCVASSGGSISSFQYFKHNEEDAKCCKPAEPKVETGKGKSKLTLPLQIARARIPYPKGWFLAKS